MIEKNCGRAQVFVNLDTHLILASLKHISRLVIPGPFIEFVERYILNMSRNGFASNAL